MLQSALRDRSAASVLRGWHLAAAGAVLAVWLQLWWLYQALGPPHRPRLPLVDKVEHAVGFALPVLLILLAVAMRGRAGWQSPSSRTYLVVITIFAVHAIVSEVIQHLWYRYRTGDPLDVVADWVGIAAGVLLFRLIYLRRSRAVESLAAL